MAGGAVDESYSLSSALSDDNARKYECSICLDILLLPKLLPCSHTFCTQCLQKHISAHSVVDPASPSRSLCFECPECRSKVGVPENGVAGLQNNRYIWEQVDLLRQNAKRVCDSCTDRNSGLRQRATRFCADCSNALCRACSTRHAKRFPSHTAVTRISAPAPDGAVHLPPALPPESVVGGKAAGRVGPAAVHPCPSAEPRSTHSNYCSRHPQELLRFYCHGGGAEGACNTVICRDCRMTSHFDHQEVVDLSTVAEQSLCQLQEDAAEVQARVDALSRRIDFYQARRDAIAATRGDVETLLEARAQKLIGKIKEYKDRAVARLQSDSAALDAEVAEEMDVARGTQRSLQDTFVGLQKVKRHGADEEIVARAKDVRDLLYGEHRIPETELSEEPNAPRGFLLNTGSSASIPDFSEEELQRLIGQVVKL